MVADYWPTSSYTFCKRSDLWLVKIKSTLGDKSKPVPEVVVVEVPLCGGSIPFLSVMIYIGEALQKPGSGLKNERTGGLNSLCSLTPWAWFTLCLVFIGNCF